MPSDLLGGKWVDDTDKGEQGQAESVVGAASSVGRHPGHGIDLGFVHVGSAGSMN